MIYLEEGSAGQETSDLLICFPKCLNQRGAERG